MKEDVVVLGAGMTGLGAGLAGLPVYEAADEPGGICSSYYMRPGGAERLPAAPKDGNAYRFELGGGHWIFGGDPGVSRLIRSIAPVKAYQRRSAVWLPSIQKLVPYPLQNHLRYLGRDLAARCLGEIVRGPSIRPKACTMGDWLRASFGPTLCELFFLPFHHLYTAGLLERIAPQDGYKSPFDLGLVVRGAFDGSPSVGYNATFIYPEEGLNVLADKMAASCDIRYGKRIVRVDVPERELHLADGGVVSYQNLVSTLPLNKMIEMTGLATQVAPDPAPSVLVVNIGAGKGPRCPEEHWVYVPSSKSGFHRVGFYSNVDQTFLPRLRPHRSERVSIYVERAYPEDQRPCASDTEALCGKVVEELREWQWIDSPEVIDPTWIEVAYTWSWAGSRWKQEALALLEANGIYQVGRYARWVFQGIADSIRDGLMMGAAMSASRMRVDRRTTLEASKA